MKNKKSNDSFIRKIYKNVKSLLLTLLVVFLISSSIVGASKVPTGSMEKTILVGDFMLINKFIFDISTPRDIPYTNIALPHIKFPSFDEPEKGDIIVFQFPGYQNELEPQKIEYWVKRCVGEPGDTISIYNNVLYVNGDEFPIPPHIHYSLDQSESMNQIFPSNSGWKKDFYGPLVIPKKGERIQLTLENIYKYKTLINRELEGDFVKTNDNKIFIKGNETDFYTIQKDYYFMVGDNRDNSLDSRYWGFVPRDKIIGTPIFIYWSWNSDIPFSDFFRLLGSVRLDRIGKIVH
ncbi:MAG: signal peptidase I [Ignavibacteriae bacterium]|nr:signal peptidase I [Ignavibacteriota bacterium]